ncbi:MAG: rod-binding protein [Pseudomonadota bacterium]
MTDFLQVPGLELSRARVQAGANSVQNLGKNANERATRQAAEEFEAVFLSQMFTHMFPDDQGEGFFGGGNGEKIFHSLLVDEFAKITAKTGGIGIADSVMRQLVHEQEHGNFDLPRKNSGDYALSRDSKNSP